MILKNFIVFEGIDGAGTTTQIKKLTEYFNQEKIYATAEPTSTETGLFLRKILKGDIKLNEKTIAHLFAADRAEHLYGKNGIIEQINNGKIAVSDRYFFSSLAYQTVSCGEELPYLLNSNFPLPELLFYFKINPEVSLKRVLNRSANTEIYEKLDYQKQTALLYDKVINDFSTTEKGKGMKVITINAEDTIENIFQIILENVKKITDK